MIKCAPDCVPDKGSVGCPSCACPPSCQVRNMTRTTIKQLEISTICTKIGSAALQSTNNAGCIPQQSTKSPALVSPLGNDLSIDDSCLNLALNLAPA